MKQCENLLGHRSSRDALVSFSLQGAGTNFVRRAATYPSLFLPLSGRLGKRM